MNKLLKLENLQLDAAGYLTDLDGNTVNQKEFVEQQKLANFYVELAKRIKDKNFKPTEIVESFKDIHDRLVLQLKQNEKVTYVTPPVKPEMSIVNQLTEEAMAFVNYTENTEKTYKINQEMQRFNKIHQVGNVGERFTDDVVLLNIPKLYTIAEILEAVTIVVEKRDY